MALVRKTGFQGNLGQVPIRILKKSPTQVQPAPLYIRRQRAAKIFLKRAGQMDPVNTGRPGEVLYGGDFGESLIDRPPNLPEPDGRLDGLIPGT